MFKVRAIITKKMLLRLEVMPPNLGNALSAAPALLGCLFVHENSEGITSGYIVETEAYLSTDAASHSYKGKTPRTEVMFGPPGYLYVYFTYGLHYCVNIVTGPAGSGEAVLIRALEPVQGIKLMRLRRAGKTDNQLTNGPAKFAKALGIDRSHNGEPVYARGNFRLLPGFMPAKIIQTTRIGIRRTVDKPWRFYVAGNPYVSKQ